MSSRPPPSSARRLLKLFRLLACAVRFCSTGAVPLHLRCPGEVASMKARLICLIRQHRWHRNDYEYPTVWTCERCGKTKVDREAPGTRVPDRTLARGSATDALEVALFAAEMAVQATRATRGSQAPADCSTDRAASVLS